MRITLGAGAIALAVTISLVQPVAAQQRPAPTDSVTLTPGAVMRVILLRFLPGKGPEATLDIRRNVLPVLEDEKAAGIIVNYSVMTNSTTDSPDDWNFGYVVSYANWAALDSLGARTGPITLRHYGTAEARTAAANHRAELWTVVQSRLVRAQNVSR